MNTSADEFAPKPRRTRLLLSLTLAALVAAGGAIWVGTASAQNDAGSEANPKPESSPPATEQPPPQTPAPSGKSLPPDTADKPGAAGPLNEKTATKTLEQVMDAPLATSETEEDLADSLKDVAGGAFLAELTAQWQELISTGWSVQGAPKVISTEVTEAEANTATVLSCLDYGEVTLQDSAGEAIGVPIAEASRALHIFTFSAGDDGVWRISGHTFPDDPGC